MSLLKTPVLHGTMPDFCSCRFGFKDSKGHRWLCYSEMGKIVFADDKGGQKAAAFHAQSKTAGLSLRLLLSSGN